MVRTRASHHPHLPLTLRQRLQATQRELLQILLRRLSGLPYPLMVLHLSPWSTKTNRWRTLSKTGRNNLGIALPWAIKVNRCWWSAILARLRLWVQTPILNGSKGQRRDKVLVLSRKIPRKTESLILGLAVGMSSRRDHWKKMCEPASLLRNQRLRCNLRLLPFLLFRLFPVWPRWIGLALRHNKWRLGWVVLVNDWVKLETARRAFLWKWNSFQIFTILICRFTKNQKRASLLLTDMQNTFVSSLISLPPASSSPLITKEEDKPPYTLAPSLLDEFDECEMTGGGPNTGMITAPVLVPSVRKSPLKGDGGLETESKPGGSDMTTRTLLTTPVLVPSVRKSPNPSSTKRDGYVLETGSKGGSESEDDWNWWIN